MTSTTLIGGVKKIHANTDKQAALKNMLRSPGVSLRNLSYTSLNSLVFELTVPASKTEYVNLGKSHRFTEKVTDFVLKCVIIKSSNTRLRPFKGVNKESSTANEFINEVQLQQQVWTGAVMQKIPPLCPSVADAFILKTATDIFTMERLLRVSARNRPTALEMLIHMFTEIEDSRGATQLGLILMPKAESSMTLYELSITPGARYTEARISAIAQTIRMAIMLDTVHFDLHSNNILVSQTATGTTSTIIDFGRAASFDNSHQYFSKAIGTKYAHAMKKSAQDMFLAKTNDEKIAFVDNILSFLFYVESTYHNNNQEWVFSHRKWLLSPFKRNANAAKLDIFNTCIQDSTPRTNRGVQNAHMNRILESGQLFSSV
jgi:hypothetical protein